MGIAEDDVIYSLIGSSMRSILHSTGVCVMSQSDFSGVKSKKHGIHHQEANTAASVIQEIYDSVISVVFTICRIFSFM